MSARSISKSVLDARFSKLRALASQGGGSSTSGIEEIRFPIGIDALQGSATSIPNGAIIQGRYLHITTPYSPGTTLTVGNVGTPDLLMGIADSVPTSGGVYSVPADDTAWPGPAQILVTVAGAPAAGAGFCVVQYNPAPQP